MDHLNSPRLVADETQKTVWKWEQDEPFGANAANEDPDADTVAFEMPLRFAGQRFDAETNLHYNYFRDYDPGIGRYGESDPIGLRGGLSTYAYDAAPLMRSDPYGLFSIGALNFFGQVGGQAGVHAIIAGVNVSVAAVVTLPNGEICKLTTYCLRFGPGIFAGAGFTAGGGGVGGGGPGLTGLSFGGGVDLGAGPSVGGQAAVGVSNQGGISSVGAVKGKAGYGYGASIGIEICYSEVACTKGLCKQ